MTNTPVLYRPDAEQIQVLIRLSTNAGDILPDTGSLPRGLKDDRPHGRLYCPIGPTSGGDFGDASDGAVIKDQATPRV